jgi:hypothetical protein
MLGRMDKDAPHPHCPFCGLPMHVIRARPGALSQSVMPAFDCRWCGVVLNVSAQAEAIELAAARIPG